MFVLEQRKGRTAAWMISSGVVTRPDNISGSGYDLNYQPGTIRSLQPADLERAFMRLTTSQAQDEQCPVWSRAFQLAQANAATLQMPAVSMPRLLHEPDRARQQGVSRSRKPSQKMAWNGYASAMRSLLCQFGSHGGLSTTTVQSVHVIHKQLHVSANGVDVGAEKAETLLPLPTPPYPLYIPDIFPPPGCTVNVFAFVVRPSCKIRPLP